MFSHSKDGIRTAVTRGTPATNDKARRSSSRGSKNTKIIMKKRRFDVGREANKRKKKQLEHVRERKH